MDSIVYTDIEDLTIDGNRFYNFVNAVVSDDYTSRLSSIRKLWNSGKARPVRIGMKYNKKK